MMRSRGAAICVFGVSLAIAGCNSSPDPDVGEEPTVTAPEPTATSGSEAAADARQPAAPAELPDTASPLAVVGAMGVLSLAGAALARVLRQE